MKFRFGITVATAFILLAAAAPARADVVLTPFVGSLFGGDLPDSKANYGATASFMGGGIIGAEIDFGYSPSFVPETLLSPAVRSITPVIYPVSAARRRVPPHVCSTSSGCAAMASRSTNADPFSPGSAPVCLACKSE